MAEMTSASKTRRQHKSAPDVDGGDEFKADELLVGEDDNAIPELSVVLPTLNEEEGIGTCIQHIKQSIEELQLRTEIVVSDSSTDRTPEIAQELGARVVKPDREGYGYAYRYAFERAQGDIIAMGDADTTYDFRRLPDLVDHLHSADAEMVLGSRFQGEIKPDAMPALHRYIGNPVLTAFLNIFYDANVSDAHSGFRVFRRELLEDLHFQSDGMEFASEMIMVAAENDVEIAEVPIVYHPREGEETLDSFTDGWRHVKFMLKNAPGYLFTGPSLAFTSVGLLAMVLSLVGVQLADVTFRTYTMIAGSLLTIVGYQVGTLAVFSSITADPIRSPRDPITNWVRESINLEHGVWAGIGFFTLGCLGATGLIWQWIDGGYTTLPDLVLSILSFTAIVVGVETIFYSFFLSILAEAENKEMPEQWPSEGQLADSNTGARGYSPGET